MDGIFGVGIGEMIVIALTILVIGGPTRSREWARQAGRMLFRLRSEFNKVMANLEKELGPDGKELLDTSRQLGKGIQEIRSTVDPRRAIGSLDKMVKDSIKEPEVPKIEAPAKPPTEENNPFSAWIPDQNQQQH